MNTFKTRQDGTVIPPKLRRHAHLITTADVDSQHQPYAADAVRPQRSIFAPVPNNRTHRNWPGRMLRLVGAGMLVMVLLVWVITALIQPFVLETVDHWHYGAARVSHLDLDVGHQGISHFLTEYWHGSAIIVEFPGGDAQKAQVYRLMIASASDQTPRVVTLRAQVVNPQGIPGKPDLVVQVTGMALAIVLYNTGEAFRSDGMQ